MQKERLTEEFTAALNLFQETQRIAAQKEKEQMQRVRANSGLGDLFGGLLNITLHIAVYKTFCRMSVTKIQNALPLVSLYRVVPVNINVSAQTVNNLIVILVGPFHWHSEFCLKKERLILLRMQFKYLMLKIGK